MNKILIAAALALTASAPLAFAANTATPPASFLTTQHCNSVEQTLDRAHYKTESAYRIAQEKAMSLCRQDRHKNGGVEFGSRLPNHS
jgi:hypothetical protein